MDAGPDAQHGVNTGVVESKYYVDVWLPDAKDYPGLRGASPKVQEALGLGLGLPDKPTVVPLGEIEINLKPRFYKRNEKNLDIDSESVAAISFSEDFAKQCNSNDVAVLAMMGGVLPAGKNFFRMGFSVETIAAIIGDQIINDNDGRVSHVFLIRVDNDLGNEFERAFSRAVNAPNQGRSLDILKIDENGTPITKKIQITPTDEQVARNTSTNEGVISKWLTSCIKNPEHPRNQGLRSVVIYGYWEQYWNFVIEVLRCKAFCNDEDWLYVESNYPLHYPFILYEARHVDDLDQDDLQNFTKERTDDIIPRSVEITSSGKNNKRIMGDKKQEKTGGESPEKPPESVFHPQKGNLQNNNEDERDFNIFNEKKMAHASTIAHAIKNRDEPEEEHQKESKELSQEKLMPRELKRIRCITGRLVNDGESSFITFAKETVRLLRAAIRDAHEKKGKAQDRTIKSIRECICKFLANSKFYAAEHLGSFFFRKDGELFFPLYLYNGKLERQRIVRESCCKGDEFTKEAIADQLLQLSNSLNKITRAEIPRNLKVGNSDGAKKVFEEFSKIIADISKGIEIKFVSYYPNTEHLFYTWTDTQEGNVDKTERFINVSIFDDVCKKIQGVIQINLKDFDLEDNDAYRVYLVYERTEKVFDALTLAEWWNTQSNDCQATIIAGNKGWERCLLPVKAVVFAKSRIGKQDGQTDEGMSENEYKDIIDNANYAHYYRDCDGHESKFKFDEILSGLCKLLGCSGDNGNSESDARFLYYIPEYIPEDNKPEGNNSYKIGGQGGIVMATCCKLSLFDLQIVENMVSHIFSKLKTCLAEHDVLLSNIKSAIGSIMSRNGSHNIGSHVLAALSHNVGTLPDDRVLYQYIQQRMDYIATVTTDFPTWTQPTMFVADMMKTFLSQRHLLDHIVESEGLHAFQFQNPNMTDEEWAAQENCVKIYVRKLDGDGSVKDFIEYEKGKRELPIDLTNDVDLAIPGGIIGEHAFYTILENIIRNAAKHSWAKIKQWQIRQNEIELQYNNLELFIDFEEKDDEVKYNVYAKLPMAQVVVEKSKADNKLCQKVIASEQLIKWKEKFDDMGVVKAKEENAFKELPDYEQEQVKLHLANLKDDPLKKWVDRYDKQGGLTSDEQKEFDSLAIHHKQQVMLARPFIDSQGALRRENWGMAEMKISAGYLAGESIEAIGGIGDKKGSNEIITPRIKSEKVKRKCIESGEKVTEIEVEELYLGYEFSIAKPKEILIIVAEELNREGKDDEWGSENIRNELKKHGIFVKTVSEIKQENRLNYRYVVHYNARELFDKNYHVKDDVLLPFRVLSVADIEDERLKDFIPTIDISKLKECFEKGTEDPKNGIQKLVYDTYLKHFLSQRSVDNIGLLVAINENEKSGGNSLISDADILELMLEQNFAVCVAQYKEFAANEDKIIKCLESIRHKSSAKDTVIKFKHFSNKTIRELIAQRMCDWAGKSNDSWIPIVEHLRKKYFVSDAESETSNELKPSNNEISVDFAASVNSLSQKHPIDDFIRYVESIFENTKKLFKQYEEQIVTLPAGYKVQSSDVGEGASLIDGIKIITSAEKEELEKEKDRHWIGYRRHAHTLPVDDSKRLYVEPLSGTQTYLSQLARVKTDLGLQMRLIENGLMRILVLDERVAKFLREHQKEVGPHYKSMNIHVIDHEWVVAGGETPPEGFYGKFTSVHKEALKSFVKPKDSNDGENNQNGNADVSSNSNLTMFDDVDILIVHQGILDKWYPEFKNRKDMWKLLEGFKKLVKYVVVTTGRGTPENIPEETHLLPFAVVESTLFKKYPEKLILTDTIMNVLPVGKKNDNSGGQK